MVLSKPVQVRTLLDLGLRKTLPEASESELSVIADKGCSILSKRANMLWDYFSIKLQTNDCGELLLHGLPVLLDRYRKMLSVFSQHSHVL